MTPKRYEIFYADLTPTVGSETKKILPVVIISQDDQTSGYPIKAFGYDNKRVVRYDAKTNTQRDFDASACEAGRQKMYPACCHLKPYSKSL